MPGGRSFVWEGQRLMGEVTDVDEEGVETVTALDGRVFKGNAKEGFHLYDPEAEARAAEEAALAAEREEQEARLQEEKGRLGLASVLVILAVVIVMILSAVM